MKIKTNKHLDRFINATQFKQTEATPEIFKKLLTKLPHNVCDGCGATVRPDQWSENNFTLCIDCG